MIIVQTNSLPLPLETFTQPCAEQRKSLVEQTEEITVKSLLESNDIQPLGNKFRFLVVPHKKKKKRRRPLNFKQIRGLFFYHPRTFEAQILFSCILSNTTC